MRVTVGVLAGAYPRNDLRSFLTHRAELQYDPAVPGSGWPMPLCKRVRLGSLTDDTTQHTQARPTCPQCARVYDREKL